jgi:hypothetical protein
MRSKIFFNDSQNFITRFDECKILLSLNILVLILSVQKYTILYQRKRIGARAI